MSDEARDWAAVKGQKIAERLEAIVDADFGLATGVAGEVIAHALREAAHRAGEPPEGSWGWAWPLLIKKGRRLTRDGIRGQYITFTPHKRFSQYTIHTLNNSDPESYVPDDSDFEATDWRLV